MARSSNRRTNNSAMSRNMAVTTRTIRRIDTFKLDNSTGQDTFNKLAIADSLSYYQTSSDLDKFYEQYQIVNTKIWAYVSGFGTESVYPSLATLLDIAQTKIYSCLDFDTNNTLDESEIISRASFNKHQLSPGYTLLASYQPRAARGTGEQTQIINPNVIWYNLESATQPVFLGLKLYTKNYGGLRYHETTGSMQEIKILVESKIKLRGEKMG